jgi:hypothetical protein
MKLHYAHPTEARWRRGRWLFIHGRGSAVCSSGYDAPNVIDGRASYDRGRVTCKRCLTIVALIEAFKP